MSAIGSRNLRFALPASDFSDQILAVGFPFESHDLDNGRGRLISVEIAKLYEGLIEEFAPNLVISPLVGRSFDCVELASRLAEIGYDGLYVAISKDLPRLDIVRSEVRAMVTGVRFDVADLGDIVRTAKVADCLAN